MLTMSIFPFNLLIYLVLLNAKKLPRVTLTPTPSPHHVVLFVIERKRERRRGQGLCMKDFSNNFSRSTLFVDDKCTILLKLFYSCLETVLSLYVWIPRVSRRDGLVGIVDNLPPIGDLKAVLKHLPVGPILPKFMDPPINTDSFAHGHSHYWIW